jgi:fructokinase
MQSGKLKLGIDLGGTKIEVAVLGDNHEILLRRRVDTPQGDYRATLETVVRLVAEAEMALGKSCTVGVGTPGSLSRHTGLLRNSNSVCLNGQPFKHDLELLLGRKIRMANDANCFALAEARMGAGRGAEAVFGVILGTGVGGGIVVQGQERDGINGVAGEWGHNPLPWAEPTELPGPACYCGKRGCIETFLSGPAMVADHERATGKRLAPADIVRAADGGDAACAGSLERYCRRLAKSLAVVINILDPEAIVLGGGLSNIGRLYDRVPELLPEYVFCDRVATPLVKHELGDSAGVIGAAWLWEPT